MRTNHRETLAHTWAGAGACGPSARGAPAPKKFTALWVRPWATLHAEIFPHAKNCFPTPPPKKQHGPKNGLIGWVRDNPELLVRVRAQQPRLVTQPVTSGLCLGKPCSPAVPSECLVALLAHPAGWLAPGIPARAGGPLRGVQSGPSWPAEALVRSRWPPVYPGVCRRSWRCPASAWRRSRPLLRGGSPLGYPLVLEGLYVGRSLAPAGLLRPWCVAGSLEYPRSGCGSVGLFKYEIACGFGEVFRFSFCPSL